MQAHHLIQYLHTLQVLEECVMELQCVTAKEFKDWVHTNGKYPCQLHNTTTPTLSHAPISSQ